MSRDGNDRYAAAQPTRRAGSSAGKPGLMTAAGRCLRLADQVDYSIRRMVIPPDERMERAAAVARIHSARTDRARPRRAAAMRDRGALSALQSAIARALGAQYDTAEPLPDRLADLLRQLERRDGDRGYRGGYRGMAVKGI
jgi:hypothetical protein